MGRHNERDDKFTGVASLLVLGAGLAGLFIGWDNWWLIFVIGYAVVVPIIATLTGEGGNDDMLGDVDRQMDDALRGRYGDTDLTERDLSPSKRDALDTLRERYAQGELSDEQFEAKLERLLDTETLEDARSRVERGRANDESGERELEFE
ncbi:SHOCT domain-containing protein [Haloarchaeobius sp. DFWS5]|uniref:SHOCT domain-containing protein n=1 Tax=Haloarchaeobius sp. DFWS5 TaxID=3446114 RepID=UPI003EB6C42D